VGSTGGFTYLDVNVTRGVTYYYAVDAVNAGGAGERSTWLNVTVPIEVPSAPMDLRVQVVDGEVTLIWNASTSDGGSPILGYSVFRGTDLEHMAYLGSVANTSFVDKELETGVTYYYAVTAVNSVGRSAPGGAVDASLPSNAPSNPDVTFLTMGGLAFLGVGVVSSILFIRKRRLP
jgi:predicted phage tail protein